VNAAREVMLAAGADRARVVVWPSAGRPGRDWVAVSVRCSCGCRRKYMRAGIMDEMGTPEELGRELRWTMRLFRDEAGRHRVGPHDVVW
jgi:hypothetical protein